MIQEGWLYFDDDPKRSITDKVERAASRYQQKYGHAATVCYVHSSEMHSAEISLLDGIKVLPASTVLPFHFWLGTEVKKTK